MLLLSFLIPHIIVDRSSPKFWGIIVNVVTSFPCTNNEAMKITNEVRKLEFSGKSENAK